MPQSRKRHLHHEHKKTTTANAPVGKKRNGRIMWAILFGVFGLIISFFGAGINYPILMLGALLGASIGYVIGKSMEKEAAD